MLLYNYFRSSAAYRVRIALNLKGVRYESAAIHLTKEGGIQFTEQYSKLNAQQLVPALDDDGVILTQSLAIMEYLEEKYPQPPLLPAAQNFVARAQVRAIALAIACDIHPLNNLRVLKTLQYDLAVTEAQKNAWIAKWINMGLRALETALSQSTATGAYCFGDSPTLADCCLVPQVFSARRFNIDLAPYPTLVRIDAQCNTLEAFIKAHPKNQADFEG